MIHTPGDQRGRRWRVLRLFHESHLAAGEEGAHDGPFPVREPDRVQLGRKPLALAALQGEVRDHALDRAGSSGLGIDATHVVDQAAVYEVPQTDRGIAAGRTQEMVLRQPPPCVKRHAECADRLSPHQGLETDLRGHRIDRRCVLDHPGGVNIIGQHGDARRLPSRQRLEVPPFAAREHVRMHFQHDALVRVLIQRRFQHGQEGCRICLPRPYRRIAP